MALAPMPETDAVSEATWWADASCARATLPFAEDETDEIACGGDDDAIGSDAEDDNGENILAARVRSMRSRVVRLADGDIHVCDDACEYAEAGCDSFGRPNGDFVCPHTGRIVHRRCECRTTASTGRSTCSTDPDMQTTCATQRGGMARRDMRRASMHAFVTAQTMVDTAMPDAVVPVVRRQVAQKRGAQCVDVATTPCTPSSPRLPNSAPPPSPATPTETTAAALTAGTTLSDELPRIDHLPTDAAARPARHARSANAVTNLHREAALIFNRLVVAPRSERAAPNDRAKRKAGLDDDRTDRTDHADLMRHDVLFAAALRKYLKEVAARGGVPSLDDINNISLAVRRVLNDRAQREDRVALNARHGRARDVEFRTAVVTLAVSLFQCASTTTHLQTVRRGADAFRPFCVGVVYAFKRGLLLPNGTPLIPKSQMFAHALADSRAAAAVGPQLKSLKSLHASSHRGLCTLHRCIASVPHDKLNTVFDAAIRAGRAVQAAL